MKKDTMHYVYKVINAVNGRYYIGKHSTDDVDDGYLGSGVVLKKAIARHGKENFVKEILKYYPSSKEALEGERSWIAECVNDPLCYNISGDAGDKKNITIGFRVTLAMHNILSKICGDPKMVNEFIREKVESMVSRYISDLDLDAGSDLELSVEIDKLNKSKLSNNNTVLLERDNELILEIPNNLKSSLLRKFTNRHNLNNKVRQLLKAYDEGYVDFVGGVITTMNTDRLKFHKSSDRKDLGLADRAAKYGSKAGGNIIKDNDTEDVSDVSGGSLSDEGR